MASVTRIEQDGHYSRVGTFNENSEIFYDVSGNTLIFAAPSGATQSWDIDTTAVMVMSATALTHSAANSGAVSTLTMSNPTDDSGAGVLIRAVAAGSSASGDARIQADETGVSPITMGIDISASLGVIAMDDLLGSSDGDALRITDADPPVVSYNATHPVGTFDYVCEKCSAHGGAIFKCDCGGTVSWHDDVAALIPALAAKDAFEMQAPAMRHLADLGVIDLSVDDDGKPGLFIQQASAQWFTWSAMAQMYRDIAMLKEKVAA